MKLTGGNEKLQNQSCLVEMFLCIVSWEGRQWSYALLPLQLRGVESSLHVAHPGYQVLSDILFRLGLIANALTQCSA